MTEGFRPWPPPRKSLLPRPRDILAERIETWPIETWLPEAPHDCADQLIMALFDAGMDIVSREWVESMIVEDAMGRGSVCEDGRPNSPPPG